MIQTENIAGVKQKLEEELSQLLGQLEDQNEQGIRQGGNLDRDDLAHNFALRERELALRDVENTRLDQIKKALERIADGTYGVCASCNEQISPERLEIIPYATLCIDCQQQRDQK